MLRPARVFKWAFLVITTLLVSAASMAFCSVAVWLGSIDDPRWPRPRGGPIPASWRMGMGDWIAAGTPDVQALFAVGIVAASGIGAAAAACVARRDERGVDVRLVGCAVTAVSLAATAVAWGSRLGIAPVIGAIGGLLVTWGATRVRWDNAQPTPTPAPAPKEHSLYTLTALFNFALFGPVILLGLVGSPLVHLIRGALATTLGHWPPGKRWRACAVSLETAHSDTTWLLLAARAHDRCDAILRLLFGLATAASAGAVIAGVGPYVPVILRWPALGCAAWAAFIASHRLMQGRVAAAIGRWCDADGIVIPGTDTVPVNRMASRLELDVRTVTEAGVHAHLYDASGEMLAEVDSPPTDPDRWTTWVILDESPSDAARVVRLDFRSQDGLPWMIRRDLGRARRPAHGASAS